MPHYLRLARAIALLSGAVVSGASAAGCYQSHERTDRLDAGPTDAWSPDTLTDAERCPTPLPCECPTLGSLGTCGSTSFDVCCPIVGPLSPPDLPIA